MLNLRDKVVLISGVGPGLGRSTAATVLENGGKVVLGDLFSDNARIAAAELDPESVNSAHAACDITDRNQCEQLVALARSRFGRLDAMVHVAAHSASVGGLLDGDLDDWETVARTNVKGTLQLTKAAVPLMHESGGGSVVFIGSIAAVHSVAGIPQLVYGMSKAGLVSATHYLARELGPLGIRINTLSPGWKWGAALEEAIGRRASSEGVTVEEYMEPVRQAHPLRRYTNDEEVAHTIAFLVSDLAPSITGQVVYIDGGLTA
ncbi:SDR family oxidoreductase [Pseudonocardia oroxyli]|uniref:NAD(P)-dependent dehydrogenase, short-chain alcohol dehydrogenase family n=1 Tax=Pseudonocardia oroxyli TaxID=366584 RepID=A0A1G7THM1_PSEOR|nr:SDR family oxidoreductase [Pseudonocardia oroxyli]SDG34818.1 NAD(P)-dependent dehydrogenase, short-chain alcohol dehydrogenase family [Pseudonocardia oroxyli]